ncbi:MBL fold metallo-hydrolase [Streptoalloteichus hindustanus]|uniref:Glyoxylase, beta-lactamase superfamily II n=1 Tax=Streptoalloteichus hindustanus TaxID=2017 RepID=A0A1M5D4E4_STRHI|nr:MBL fold metallo-hydrolase [Streptoalloteichus hindustanus]SHF61848.1 Glyoxylase, beta-lactamase superfamily II [Streptoalloteichus hindustanus]
MQEIVLGDVAVTRVVEYHGPVGMSPQTFFPDSPEKAWRDNESWLAPDFLDPTANGCVSALQTWVLRSQGKTILVDTGAGNHKERSETPRWHHLNTDFLDNLARAGVRPEDVDLVVNTHLHVDHVGWNTRLDGDTWVPTFPNATYLIPRADFDFWNPANGHKPGKVDGWRNVFEDSVAPVHEAGQTLLWDNSHAIDANLRLDLAPGHTPGSSVLTLESGGDRALFVGDVLHNPVQIVAPDTNSCFCEDPAEARATRRRLLGRASDTNALVLPAHLAGHGAAEVVRKGDAFAIRAWAAFSRI